MDYEETTVWNVTFTELGFYTITVELLDLNNGIVLIEQEIEVEVFGSIFTDFEDASKGSYAIATFESNDFSYIADNSLVGSDASDAKLGNRSLRLRNQAFSALITNFTVSQVEFITFHTAHSTFSGDKPTILSIEVSTDFENWVVVKNDVPVTSLLTMVRVDFDYDSIDGISATDLVYIRIVNRDSSTRANIDNLRIVYNTDGIFDQTGVQYEVNLSTLQAGAAVSKSVENPHGILSPLTITASEVDDYLFVHWFNVETQTVFSTNRVHTFNVTQDLNLVAVYEFDNLIYKHDFGTTGVTGFDSDEITWTNTDGLSFTESKERVEIRVSTFSPHAGRGGILVMAPTPTTPSALIEFDFTSYLDIDSLDFLLSREHPNNIARINDLLMAELRLEKWVEDEWTVVYSMDVRNTLDDTYQLFSFKAAGPGNYRLIYEIKGGTSTFNTGYAITIDDLALRSGLPR